MKTGRERMKKKPQKKEFVSREKAEERKAADSMS